MSREEAAIETLIQKISSGKNEVIREAEAIIAQWETENFVGYLCALCLYICNGSKISTNRFFAGLLFNNSLTPKEANAKMAKHAKWFTIDDNIKNNMKLALLNQLSMEDPKIRSCASQVISTIALVELPVGKWPDLIRVLLNNVTNQSVTPALKQATLDCIGYILTSIDAKVLVNSTSEILTAVVHGMRPDEHNIMVKRSACKALYNSLEFCKGIFFEDSRQTERDVLMTVILDAAGHTDEEIASSALEIIVVIAAEHYDKLTPYMQKIFKITLESIKNRTENIAKQAIEFWSTVAETEKNIKDEIAYHQEMKLPPPAYVCQYFTKGALPFLVPLLTQALPVKEGEEVDLEEWTINKASALCISYISQTVEAEILPHIIPFIEQNITSQDWRRREAAVLAFMHILEGPKDKIGTLVSQAIPLLLDIMKDPKSKTAVKDTTAYTVGQILKFHHQNVLHHSETILGIMAESLKDKPRVASNAAWAISNFATAFQSEPVNPLNTHFQTVVQMLLVTSDRSDADDDNLRGTVYDTINTVLGVAPPNQYAALEELMKLFLDRIESTLRDSSKQPQKQALQEKLCGVVQVLTMKLESKVKPFADRIMGLIYKFFKAGTSNSDLHQESFMIVSAIVNSVGHDFVKYMNEFSECLYVGLSNAQEYQVCFAAVGLVGDISRTIKNQLMPYCDKIVLYLLQNLSKPELDKSIKPIIITTFGDIACAIGSLFSKYFEVVMNMLKQAGDTVAHTNIAEAEDQDDLIDYLNSLRESIFEAYTGIFQSLCSSKTPDMIIPYLINSIIPLVNNVYADVHRSEAVAVAAVGLCGDIASALGQRVRSTLSAPHILRLIDDTKTKAEQAETKGICDFAQRAISQM